MTMYTAGLSTGLSLQIFLMVRMLLQLRFKNQQNAEHYFLV
jgi:hypothetical protein